MTPPTTLQACAALVSFNKVDGLLDQTKAAVAVLIACIVQILGESDSSFQERFERRLDDWYNAIRDRTPAHFGDGLKILEMLSWAREAVRSKSLFGLDKT